VRLPANFHSQKFPSHLQYGTLLHYLVKVRYHNDTLATFGSLSSCKFGLSTREFYTLELREDIGLTYRPTDRQTGCNAWCGS